MTGGYDGKPIRLSDHARGYLVRRGFTEGEVAEAVRTCAWRSARNERWEAERDRPYDTVWNGRHDATKRIRPIFVENSEEIVVVTVYAYSF
ncbi:MAG: DUF4258 domain-containing protein [Thermomicrobiales bacterium]